jgi:hypothetical protein
MPACVTTTGWPATVMVAVRLLVEVLAWTVAMSVQLPVPTVCDRLTQG